ncbi:MAG: RNA-binding S4 domain-containing protein [Anaerolineales bacterium]
MERKVLFAHLRIFSGHRPPERRKKVPENNEQDQIIRLDQFMKLSGLAMSGGQAKHLIQGGYVFVNGELETHRSRKLQPGDQVTLGDQTVTVEL